jgi:hypothetical protein
MSVYKYYLFTNNYLTPHKKHYNNKSEAYKALNDIIHESENNRIKELQEAAAIEVKYNKENGEDDIHAQNMLKNFNGFSESELEVSIRLLKLDPFDDKFKEIFKEKT